MFVGVKMFPAGATCAVLSLSDANVTSSHALLIDAAPTTAKATPAPNRNSEPIPAASCGRGRVLRG